MQPRPGGVVESLFLMRGVWHDHLHAFDLDGNPVRDDPHGGTPGPFPYENLVYVDFDGARFVQTNVVLRGRPLQVRTVSGDVRDGVLHFDSLGPGAPLHVGVSGGPGVVVFCPAEVGPAWQRYSEPDVIRLLGAGLRNRHTILYRDGRLVRVLTVAGVKISPTAERRVDIDPRGVDGPVHHERDVTTVFRAPEERA